MTSHQRGSIGSKLWARKRRKKRRSGPSTKKQRTLSKPRRTISSNASCSLLNRKRLKGKERSKSRSVSCEKSRKSSGLLRNRRKRYGDRKRSKSDAWRKSLSGRKRKRRKSRTG